MSNSLQPEAIRVCTVCDHPNPITNVKCDNCGLPLIVPSDSSAKTAPPPKPVAQRPLGDLSGGTVTLFVQGTSQPVVIHPDRVIVLGVREHPGDTSVNVDFKTVGGPYLGVDHQHAVLRLIGDYVHLEDLGSQRGTFVNNERLEPGEQHRLRNGDQLRLGDLLVVFMYYGDSRSARLI